MFLKRLSTALCAFICFSGFVLGANPETLPNAKLVEENNSLLAPLAYGVDLVGLTPVTCHNYSDGYVDFVINDGIGPFEYRLERNGSLVYDYKSLPDTELNGLAPGSYRLYVRDLGNSNTVVFKDIEIDNPADVVLTLISSADANCSTGSGQIVVQASGSSGYTYSIDDLTSTYSSNNTNGTFGNLSSGNFELRVVDGKGCSASLSELVNIKVPDPINFNFTVTQISCDDVLGSVKLTNLPSDNYEVVLLNSTVNSNKIQFTTVSDGRIYNNLEAGSYTLNVARPSCSTDIQSETFTIATFDPINIVTSPISPVALSCGGANDFTDVTVTIAGGNSSRQVRIVLDNNNGISTDDPEIIDTYGTANIFEGIGAGNYTIRWNDVLNPTCSGFQTYTISEPASAIHFVDVPVQSSASCYGENNGKISFNVTGGTVPYTYIIDGSTNVTNVDAIVLAPGNHSLQVADRNGCSTSTESFVIGEYDQLTLDVIPELTQQLTCVDGTNGQIVVQSMGGSGNYYYTLLKNGNPTSIVNTKGDARRVFSNLEAGVYTIQVNDGLCSTTVSDEEEIDEVPEVVTSVTALNPVELKCRDGFTNFWVNAIGGPGRLFTYSLYRGSQFIESRVEDSYTDGVGFGDLAPDNYTIWIKYDNACDSVFESISIYNPKKFVVTYPDSVNVKCSGDAEITSAFVRGTGESPFYYSLDGINYTLFAGTYGESTYLTGLQQGANNVYFRDNLGCDYNNGAPVTIVMVEPDEITTSIPVVTNVNCKGINDGTVSIDIQGGTPGYQVTMGSYTEVSSGGTVKFTTIPAGTYQINVTDNKGCTLSSPITGIVVEEPQFEFEILEPNIIEPILCDGGLARVVITATGGWNSNRYISVAGQGIDLPPIMSGESYNLPEGSYTLTATNDYGCIKTTSVTVTAPDPLVLTVTNKTDVTCAGADDASFTINVTGGTLPYEYGLGDKGSADQPFTGSSVVVNSGLESTTYQVVVSDANFCQSNVVPVTILEPDPITFDYVVDSVTCFGGSNGAIRLVNIQGGSGTGYQAVYSTGGAETTTTTNIRNLTANTYQVRVVDNSGICYSETQIIKVGEPAEITIIGVDVEDIKCYGIQEGNIKINAQGGLPYGLEYKITGKSYQANNEFSGLAAGNYTVYVRNDRGNCETTLSNVIVETPLELKFSASSKITQVTCHNLQNGKAQVKVVEGTGTGSINYFLEGPTGNELNSSGDFYDLGEQNKLVSNYSITVSDENGCEIDTSFSIQNPEELVISLLSKTDVLCSGDKNGTMTVRVTGGTVNDASDYKFADYVHPTLKYTAEFIFPNDFRFTGLGTTSSVSYYKPIVTDNNGCTDSLADEVEIINPEKVDIVDVESKSRLCYGDYTDSTIVYAIGGIGKFEYSLDNGTTWSEPGDSVFIGEAAGDKYPLVRDENMCTDNYPMFTLEEPDPLFVRYEFDPFMCSDDESADLLLFIAGGTGMYELSIGDPNFENNTLEINRSTQDTTEFSVENDAGQMLDAGIHYEFYLRDENNCYIQNISGVRSYSDVFAETTFTKPEDLVLLHPTQNGVKCSNEPNGEIIFKATGGTEPYLLTVEHQDRDNFVRTNEAGNEIIGELFSGFYHVTLTDKYGCKGKTDLSPTYPFDTITVATANDSLSVTISEIVQPTCNTKFDGTISIDVEDYLKDGVTVYLSQFDSTLGIWVDIGNEDTIYADDHYVKDPDSDNLLYYMQNQMIEETMNIGHYEITVVDNYSLCEAIVPVDIFSINGDSCPPVNYFNTFTPHNGDGVNDEWVLLGTQSQKYRLQIYTSYGELVYNTSSELSGKDGIKWTGVDNRGRPVPAGTYIYLLFLNEGGSQILSDGNITIVRSDGSRW